MLSSDELLLLLKDLESDRVERKPSVSDKDRICEAICGFSNDFPNHCKPGIIFIGVNDDGTCANLVITDRLLCEISDMRSSGNILPFPLVTVQKQALQGCEVVVVEVSPSPDTPVRYRGRVWIRVGPTRRVATAAEERILIEKKRSGDLNFEQRPVETASFDDLDIGFFEKEYLPNAVDREILERNCRELPDQLASLHFLRNGTPNYAAVLVFGKDPRQWIPGAYIQFARFDGKELTDAIRHQKEIQGPLPQLLRELDEILLANISIATTMGAIEEKRPDYPIEALRQICRNAVIHRAYDTTNNPARIYWFSDRIEVHSPGGPYGQVTCENFGRIGVTDYRNPTIAGALKNLGYVQRFGIGIPLANDELKKNGNSPLVFDCQLTNIVATIYKKS